MNVNSPVQMTCLAATGLVTGATGAATGAKGCAVARTGAGVYTLTAPALNPWPANTGAHVSISVQTNDGISRWARTSDTVITVTTEDAAGAALDVDFTACVWRID